jgi:hypothetical protein
MRVLFNTNASAYELLLPLLAHLLLPLLAYWLLVPPLVRLLLHLLLAHHLYSTAAQHPDSLTGASIGDLTCSGQIRFDVPVPAKVYGAKYPLS